MIVYVSIGNSDGKLNPLRWASFCQAVRDELGDRYKELHGEWYSLPNSRWVNACWCVEIDSDNIDDVKLRLRVLAKEYEQNSIAWAEVPTTVLLVPGK